MKLEKKILANDFDPSKIVSSHEIFSKKSEMMSVEGVMSEQKKFNDNGLFSRRIFGDMDSEEEYSCECGNLIGEYYEGSICQKCGTPVEHVGPAIDKMGWIDLSLNKYDSNGVVTQPGNGFHLIAYIAYYQLEKVMGKENLKNVIHTRNTITITGEIDTEELEEIRNSSPEAKYWYYGIEKFYDNYNEILDYYFSIRGEKYPDFYNSIKNKDEVFIDKIPVLSIILRPAMRTAEGLKLDDINLKYQNILKNIEMLQDPNMIPIIRDATVEQIQAEFMLLSQEIMNNIKSKNGLIRNNICGTRINYSARNIITPANKEYKLNEIVLPYLAFLELFKFEIIGIIKEIQNCSLKDAELRWFNATLKFDQKVYNIMKKMIMDNDVEVLLNRNPTLSYGSILCLRVAEIKKDYNDCTLSVPITLLSLLAGDFDGDVLNLISIKDRTTRMVFKDVFSPIHILIDPNSGRFSNRLNLERDQILGISSLLNKK